MKKVTSWLLLLSLVTLLLPAFAVAEGTVTLEWFMDYAALPSKWNLEEPVFAGITQATGVQCSFNMPAEDASTKLNLLMISRNLPDIITTSDGDLRSELIAAGLVWDLDELLKTYVPESHLFTHFPADLKQSIIDRDGGWYCYPSHMSSEGYESIWGYCDEDTEEFYKATKYDNRNGIFLRKAYLDQLGIDVNTIKTEQDLMDVLQKFNDAGLTNTSGASVYTMMVNGDRTVWLTMDGIIRNTFGAMPLTDDGQYQSIFYTDEYRDGASFLNHCAQKGFLTETHLIMDEETLVSLTNSGRVACYIGPFTTLGSGTDLNDVWVSPGAITPDSGATPVLPYSAGMYTGWLNTMVSKNAKDPAACARFIDYMSSREGMLLHMYGVEGVDYTWDGPCLVRTEEGMGKVEDGVTGIWGFYAFQDGYFPRSVEHRSLDKMPPTMAYSLTDNVVVYDASPFDIPAGYVSENEDMTFIEIETNNYLEATLPKILLAPDDQTFNDQYDAFLAEMTRLGRKDYDAYLNIKVQENAEKRGIELKPVN